MTPHVLIVHSAYWTGIARLPIVLKEAGATVTVMCPKGSFLEWTRFADERIIGSQDFTEFVDQLRAHLQKREYEWVILADDDLLAELARYVDDPRIRRVLPVTSAVAIDMAASKITFIDVCKAHHLPVSLSQTVQTLEEAEDAAQRFGYPVMLKLSTGSGGVGVKKIDGPDELKRDFVTFSGGRPLTIERFITGLIAGAELLFDHGVPLCWSSYYKEKRWPGEFGPSAVRRVMEHPQVEQIARRLGAITGFHGLAVLCFIHDTQRDELVLLEMNFRPGTGMHFRGPIRRMFAEAMRALITGTSYQGRRTPNAKNHVIHMFPQDAHRAIAERDYGGILRLAAGGLYQDLPCSDVRLLRSYVFTVARELRSKRS
jgi:biotin carboxylase